MPDLVRRLTADGWEWVVTEPGGGGGGGAPSGPAGGFLTGTYPDPDPPAWWTVDSTPGSESVEFHGNVRLYDPNNDYYLIRGFDPDGVTTRIEMGSDGTFGTYGPGLFANLTDGTPGFLVGPANSEDDFRLVLAAPATQTLDILQVQRDNASVLAVGPTGAVTISPSDPAADPLHVTGADGKTTGRLAAIENFDGTVGLSLSPLGELSLYSGDGSNRLLVTDTGAVTISPAGDPGAGGLTVQRPSTDSFDVLSLVGTGEDGYWGFTPLGNIVHQIADTAPNALAIQTPSTVLFNVGPTGAVTISPTFTPVFDDNFFSSPAAVRISAPELDDGGDFYTTPLAAVDADDRFLAGVLGERFPYAPYDYQTAYFTAVQRSTDDGHIQGGAALSPFAVSIFDYDNLSGEYTKGSVLLTPGQIASYSDYVNNPRMRFMNEAGTLRYVQVTGTGQLVLGGVHTAIGDGGLNAGEMAFHYDDNDATPSLKIKARTADSTFATATIPLTPS